MRKISTAFAVAALALTTVGLSPASAEAPTNPSNDNGCYVPLPIAHRLGGSPGKDENMLPAMTKSLSDGVEIMEMDLMWTKPDANSPDTGVPIVMHDNTLKRTTDATGDLATKPIAELTYDQIKNVKTNGNPEKSIAPAAIPTMDEFLAAAEAEGATPLIHLEFKNQPSKYGQDRNKMLLGVVDSLKTYNLNDNFIIGSFDNAMNNSEGVLKFFKDNPDTKNAKRVLFTNNTSVSPEAVVEKGADVLGPYNTTNSFHHLQKFQARGLEIDVWYHEATKGDEPKGWDKEAQYKPEYISTDFTEKYMEWAKTTDYCTRGIEQNLIKSDANALDEVKAKVKKGKQILLAERPLVADQTGNKVTFKVTKGKAKLVTKSGKTFLKGVKPSKVTVTLSAAGDESNIMGNTVKYKAFTKTMNFKVVK